MIPSSTTARPTLAIWHGYLLGATGSNIYTHHLVESWVRSGHDVVLASQEPDPSRHPSIHEVLQLEHDRSAGVVTVHSRQGVRNQRAGEGRCTMVVPDINGVLPVYVVDRYEGFEVVRLPELEDERLAAYCADHAAAMQWVVDRFAPAGVLVNHASPLPAAIISTLDAAGIPLAVKVHGSELEYALVEDRRLVAPAADALARSASVLVGSDHIERRTRELLGDAAVEGRVATVPPGVDLDRFRPIAPEQAAGMRDQLHRELDERVARQSMGRDSATSDRIRALVESGDASALVAGLAAVHDSYEERHAERTASDAMAALGPDDRLLVYVGKLIPQKGVHVLLAALPLVLARHPQAHLVVAGFGPLRDGLEALLVAMAARDEAAIDALAAGMGSLSGEGADDLPHLREFLAARRAAGTLDAWLDAAATHHVDEHVSWLGLVDHGVLAQLWPLAEASIVPSVLAEAFGMVAAEAAATGCVPVVSDHSGLGDAARVIEHDGVAPVRFDVLDTARAVDNLAAALIARLDLDPVERRRQAAAARTNVARCWSWDALADQVAGLMTGTATT